MNKETFEKAFQIQRKIKELDYIDERLKEMLEKKVPKSSNCIIQIHDQCGETDLTTLIQIKTAEYSRDLVLSLKKSQEKDFEELK